MAFKRSSVGIDIGSHSLKVVRLQITDQGAFIQKALYFDRARLAARGVDPGERAALAELLHSQMAEHRIPTKQVVLAIPGGESILRYTSVPPVPAWKLQMMMRYEVDEVAEKVGESLASAYRTLSLPREAEDDQLVLVALCKEQALETSLSELEAAGIRVGRAVPAPFALFTAYEAFGPKVDPESPEDDLSIVLDLGRAGLNIAILWNGRLAYARSASFGGDAFTQALSKELGIDEAKAEEYKIKAGTVDLAGGGRGGEAAVNALRGAAAQLVNLIQSSLRFARGQAGLKSVEPTRLALLGGGARLRGLVGYLQKALGIPVEVFHPHGVVATGTLDGDASKAFGSFPGDFAVCLGLALAGVKDQEATLNLLPKRYVEKRRFRDRTVFLHAAGILVLANLLFGFLAAYKVNADADSRAALLQSRKQELAGLKQEMEANAAENERVRARLNRVLREVGITGFQALVLDYLKSQMPAEVRLKRLGLTAELDDAQADFRYRLILEGTADNANQRGLEVLQGLLALLEAHDAVETAKPLKMDPVGTAYEFQIELTPEFRLY
jgi:type IV pilus assembly protein PilM